MGFQFAVLGSVTFWIFYIVISLFAGIILMRWWWPDFLKWLLGENKGYMKVCDEFPIVLCTCIFYFGMWPLAIVGIICYYIFGFTFGSILGPGIRKILQLVNALTPDISIKVKKEGDDG